MSWRLWTWCQSTKTECFYFGILIVMHCYITFVACNNTLYLSNVTTDQLVHCVSKKDTDVAHYNFNAHQPILVFFWKKYCWVCMLSNDDLLSTFSSLYLCTTWENMHSRNWVFLVMLYTVSKTTLLCLAISSTFVNQFWDFFTDNKPILLGTMCKYYFSFSHISMIQIRKQDQCYQLCGYCIVCSCRDDGQMTHQSAAFATTCRQGLRSCLCWETLWLNP